MPLVLGGGAGLAGGCSTDERLPALACIVRRSKRPAEGTMVFISAKAKRAMAKRKVEKARKEAVRSQKRTRLAIEHELEEGSDQAGSASSVGSSSSSKSPGSTLRVLALQKRM